jgi:hypothetical protein
MNPCAGPKLIQPDARHSVCKRKAENNGDTPAKASGETSNRVRLKSNGNPTLAPQVDPTEPSPSVHILSAVGISSYGWMCVSPSGPFNDVSEVDPSLRKADRDAADFLDRPAEQWR